MKQNKKQEVDIQSIIDILFTSYDVESKTFNLASQKSVFQKLEFINNQNFKYETIKAHALLSKKLDNLELKNYREKEIVKPISNVAIFFTVFILSLPITLLISIILCN